MEGDPAADPGEGRQTELYTLLSVDRNVSHEYVECAHVHNRRILLNIV